VATLSPLAIALQGLGYPALLVALQGLVGLLQAAVEAEAAGGGTARNTRRKVRRVSPALPLLDQDEDELLLMLGVL
jgi:hypothetical protein